MRVRSLFVMMLALLLATPVVAQETTGSIEGVVRDAGGAVLPGATVVATGPSGAVTSVANERGEYRIQRLPSGRYTVAATLDGFAPATRNVDLTVGTTARVEFTLSIAGVTETVQVSAETPAIDLRSPQTATTISRERIEFVPRGRDFTDVVGQAAGAANESQAGGISINGSSGSENRFIIDGIDTTSPQVGTNSVPMRAEFMEEVQVKSAGYAAEFGGSTGGVINAITRSGTNNFHGNLLADFEARSWGGSERPILRDNNTAAAGFSYVNPPKDDETRIDPGFALGGPILRDRLWFFGSYQPGLRETERTVNFTNGVTNTFDQEFRVHYGAANVTGNIGSKVLFRVGGNFSPYETTGTLPGQSGETSLTEQSQYTRGEKGRRQTYSGSVDYIPTSRLAFSARAGRFLTDRESTGVNFPGIIHNISTGSTAAGLAAIPGGLPNTAGYTSDVLVTDATAFDEYVRDFVGLDASYFLNLGGEHQFKVGLQTEAISNDVQSGYNADRILYYAGVPYTSPGTGQTNIGQYGTFRLLNISTLGEAGTRNTALFVQDTWRVRPNLTLNAGIRSERERVPNFGTTGVEFPIEFGWGDKLAPRVGFTYDPFNDGRTKIYGSWGLYYDVMKYELPRGAFGGDRWVDYWFTWDNPDVSVNTAAGCATGTNTVSESPTCPGGTFIQAFDQRHNAAENVDEFVDPDLGPMQEQEFQIGASREFNWGDRLGGVVLGARYIRKDLQRAIEDVGVTTPTGTVYYMANPGEGITLTLAGADLPGFPKAERQYDGLELTMERRFAGSWGLSASYTLSRLYGNYSGLASSDENGRTSPNVNRFFDQVTMAYDKDGNLVYGRLGTDRPHQFKAQLMYRTPWLMTVGLNQRIASGIPLSEEHQISGGYPFFPNGRGNMGRTPVLSTTDLSLFQDVPVFGNAFQLQLTVLNLFDQDTVTRRDNTRYFGSATLPLNTAQFFNTDWDYEALLAANPSIVDPKFGQANQYLAPRQIRLTAKFTF